MTPDPDPTDRVRRLLHERVPEVADGRVQLKAIAREAGKRTMIAVFSESPHIDPIGVCVGIRGTVIKAIVLDLQGERVDIIRWAEAAEVIIRGAFHPQDVVKMLFNEGARRVEIATRVCPSNPDMFLADRLDLLSRLTGYDIRVASALT